LGSLSSRRIFNFMDHCLYCTQAPRSEEHPLSAALGEFKDAPTLRDRICRDCNGKRIGLLDEQLVRCGPIGVLRKQLGIEGRAHHDKVNPFYRGSAGGQRLKFFTRDENFGCEVLVELTGRGQGRQLSQLILKGQEGPLHHIPLTATTTIELLRKQIAELKLVAPLEARLIFDPPTEPWAADLFKQLWPDRELPESTLGADRFQGGIVQIQVTNRYFRAIAKTGFHYFLTQFPNYSGHEAIFSDIREFITNDERELVAARINRFVRVHKKPIAPTAPVLAHLLCAEIREGVCLAHFEPFITPGSRLRAFVIYLGVDPAMTDYAFRAHGHFYYAQGKSGRYSGEALEITRDQLDLEETWFEPVIEPATKVEP
jgi:hypothetical protein